MAALPSDALLRGTRLLLRIGQGVLMLGGIALVAATPAIWIFRDKITVHAVSEGMKLQGIEPFLAITVLMAGGLVLIALAFLFLRKLIAIIDSLKDASPFVPENATRLRHMGWLVLAMQGLALVGTPVGLWVAQSLPGKQHVEIGFDFGALITALLLFILARVFDHGTRLEEDVEGTV